MARRPASMYGARRLDEMELQFEQAVQNIDRPKWHPDKARQMAMRYKERISRVQKINATVREMVKQRLGQLVWVPNYLRVVEYAARIYWSGNTANYEREVCTRAESNAIPDYGLLNDILREVGLPPVRCRGGGAGGLAALASPFVPRR